MSTFGTGGKKEEEIRQHNIKRNQQLIDERIKRENEATGKEKLEIEIYDLNRTVLGCRYDLQFSSLSANSHIKEKLEDSEKLLAKKREELKIIEEKEEQNV